jgi:small subunit ribosomal protein S17
VSESTRGRRKSLIGTVVSVKMDKTAVVSVERRYPHQLYHKIIRSTKRYKAHDPENAAVLGDTVRIVETRPISKEKRWRIAETLVRGNVAEIAPREIGAPEESLYRPERSEPAPTAAVAVAEPEDPVKPEEAVVVAEPEVEAAAEPEAAVEEIPAAEIEEAPLAEETPAAEGAAEGDDKE